MMTSECGNFLRLTKRRSRGPLSRWSPALLPMLLVGSLSSAAEAQTEAERANARAAATAGADAFDAGDFATAADLFSRAESLVHSSVHLWYIARSKKELGQLVNAQENCVSVQREGVSDGASRGVVAAYEGCREILEELSSVIPTLTIQVTGAVDTKPYKVLRNGREVPGAMVGIPAPVDPGQQVVVVEGEGYESVQATVTVEEGAKESVRLELTETAVPAAAVVPAEETPQEETAAMPEDSAGGLRPPPWSSYLAWGLGLGGIGVGVGFGLAAQSEADRADELCGPGGREACDPLISDEDLDAAHAANDAAGTNQMISIIGYSAGGAALATGFVIWLVHASKAKETADLSHPRLRPIVGFGHLGLAGTF